MHDPSPSWTGGQRSRSPPSTHTRLSPGKRLGRYSSSLTDRVLPRLPSLHWLQTGRSPDIRSSFPSQTGPFPTPAPSVRTSARLQRTTPPSLRPSVPADTQTPSPFLPLTHRYLPPRSVDPRTAPPSLLVGIPEPPSPPKPRQTVRQGADLPPVSARKDPRPVRQASHLHRPPPHPGRRGTQPSS